MESIRHFTIRQKIQFIFCFCGLLTLFTGIYGIHSLNQTINDANVIADCWLEMQNDGHRINEGMAKVRINAYKAMTVRDASQLPKIKEAIALGKEKIKKNADDYESQLIAFEKRNPEMAQGKREDFQCIRTQIEGFLADSDRMVSLQEAGNSEEAAVLSVGDGYKSYMGSQQAVDALIDEDGGHVDHLKSQAHATQQQTLWIQSLVIALGLVFIGMAGILLYRSIQRSISSLLQLADKVEKHDLTAQGEIFSEDELGKLTRSYNNTIRTLRELVLSIQQKAQNVASASEELSASAEETAAASTSVAVSISKVADEAEKQAGFVANTVEHVTNISGHINTVSDAAAAIQANTDEVEQAAASGQSGVDAAMRKMKQIEATVTESAQAVISLGKRSREIGDISSVIAGIADQTNLLALDAAIEAARAGDAGRGFSVVAEEVRQLAEESQKSAQHISELISHVQQETEQAVQGMKNGSEEVRQGTETVLAAGEAFGNIAARIDDSSRGVHALVTKIQTIADSAHEVVALTEQLNVSGQQISAEAQNVSASVEEQTAASEEIASSSENMAETASSLQKQVEKFQV